MKNRKVARLRLTPKSARTAAKKRAAPQTMRPPRDGSKLGKMLALLLRPTGASMGELVRATAWREHSIRGALAGTIKKRLGLCLTSERSGNRRRRYFVKVDASQPSQGTVREVS